MLLGIQMSSSATVAAEGNVLFDVSGISAVSSGAGATSFNSFTFNVGSGSNGTTNLALIAALHFVNTPNGTSPTLSYNGTSMSLIDSYLSGVSGGIFIFGLTASGGLSTGNHAFNSSWTTNSQVCISALSVVGADQTGGSTTFQNIVKATGTSGTASTGVVTNASNRIAFGAYTANGAGFTTQGNTDIGPQNGGNLYDAAANYAASANPTLTYNLTSAAWSAVGVSIKGA